MIDIKKINDVIQIKSGRKIWGGVPFYSYCFLIDDLLIDTGPPNCAHELAAFCRHTDITRAVNTHHHEDHVGGNHLIQKKCGIKIYASPSTINSITQSKSIQLYRRLVWGMPKQSDIQPLLDTIETASGRKFQMIPTPGHCEDHVCFWEDQEGWLFTGDAFLHPKIKVFRKDEHFHSMLASLRTMLELQPRVMFCSLNGRLSNAVNSIKRKIDFMEHLKFETQKLHRQGMSPQSIRKMLLGNESHWYYFTLGHFSKQNLIDAILC